MPAYECHRPVGRLSEPAKAPIADEITTIHTDATGAPEFFVNVMFHGILAGDSSVARKPAINSYVFGAIRHGRDVEICQAMLRDLSRMWTRATGQCEDEVRIALTEVDPANALEGGLALPEPGHEQESLDENRDRLAEFGVRA